MVVDQLRELKDVRITIHGKSGLDIGLERQGLPDALIVAGEDRDTARVPGRLTVQIGHNPLAIGREAVAIDGITGHPLCDYGQFILKQPQRWALPTAVGCPIEVDAQEWSISTRVGCQCLQY